MNKTNSFYNEEINNDVNQMLNKTPIKKEFNYYESEIDKINFKLQYPVQIKLSDSDGNKTKWLSLNEESAKVIIKKFKKEFNLK